MRSDWSLQRQPPSAGCGSPGGLRALQSTGKVKDHIYFAAGLMLLLTFVAIIVTPFPVSLLLTVETPYRLPYGRIVIFVLVFLLLPLAVGHLINGYKPDLANLAKSPILLISNISFIATIALTLALNKKSTSAIGTRGVVAMLIMIVGGLIAGWLFGGPAKATRRVVAVNTGMRNVALCLVIATRAFSTPDVEVAVLALAALMVPPNTLFTLYHSVNAKRAQTSALAR